MPEIKFQSDFEEFGEKSIVGNCKANRGEKLQFNLLTDKQIKFAEQNGVKITDNGYQIYTAIIPE
jgi:peroxiredoxin